MNSNNEIDRLKKMINELNKRVDQHILYQTTPKKNALEVLNNSQEKTNKNLSFYDQEVAIKSYKSQIKVLRNENKKLEDNNIKLKEDYNSKVSEMKQHEQKMREFFEIYKKDKKDIYNYQLMVEKLKYEIAALRFELTKQEDKYEKLKSQMSYRLGSSLISVKKTKDIVNLPKKILTDYIDFKSNLKQRELEVLNGNSQLQLLSFNKPTDHKLFDDESTIFLESGFTPIVLESDFNSDIDLQLYGVKAKTSVVIEVKIQAINDNCTFRIKNQIPVLHQLNEGESYVTSFTITDDITFPFLNLISNKGKVKISFKKIRGVPACLVISRSDGLKLKNVNIGRELDRKIAQLKELASNKVVIPPLKKPNAVLFEAEQLISTSGKDIALAFAEKNMKKKFKPALNILHANIVLGNDEKWLYLINQYLKSFGCSPIKLNKLVDNELYYKITADKPDDINSDVKVSIIMPSFNAESTIKNSIDSILNQTWRNIELIIVNDCSEDSTWSIIEEFAAKDERVVAINNPRNVGAYVSKNIGLKVASGDYITGHDSDDWAHPQRIENHLKAINSEKVRPRASLTRMIRMEENGHFPFYLEGTFCLDGVLRVASITCMFEVDFLRNVLGGWDCSRFGADSEIISRTKMVLGDEFKDYHQISMICLNAPNSLTNNPIHGVQRGKGLSPSRKFYKDQWTEWHKTIDINNVYLEFPHFARKFDVPEGTEIPRENILSAIKSLESKFGSN